MTLIIAAIILALPIYGIAASLARFVTAYQQVHGLVEKPAPKPPSPEEVDAEIRRLVNSGQIVPAIQYHRKIYNSQLKDAKYHVDRIRGVV